MSQIAFQEVTERATHSTVLPFVVSVSLERIAIYGHKAALGKAALGKAYVTRIQVFCECLGLTCGWVINNDKRCSAFAVINTLAKSNTGRKESIRYIVSGKPRWSPNT